MYNKRLSVQIYQQLTHAKVINARQLDQQDQFVDNPLYVEIMSNKEIYQTQYEMSGHLLTFQDDFIYLQAEMSDPTKDEMNRRAPLLFMLMSRYLLKKGYRFEKLSHHKGGLTPLEVEEIGALDDTQEWLDKAEMGKYPFAKNIKLYLIDRGLMLEKNNGAFILSDAGSRFFTDLFERHTTPAPH
jgi:hypothetical protein